MTQGGVKTGLITEYHYLHCNHYPPYLQQQCNIHTKYEHWCPAVMLIQQHAVMLIQQHVVMLILQHAVCTETRQEGFQTQGQDSGHLPTQRPACYCVTFFRQPLFLGLSQVGQIALSMETREADLKRETCGTHSVGRPRGSTIVLYTSFLRNSLLHTLFNCRSVV